MQGITTKYYGPAHTGGPFVSATSASGLKTRIDFDDDRSEMANHAEAAKQLAEKLNWAGSYYGATTADATMVWVPIGENAAYFIAQQNVKV